MALGATDYFVLLGLNPAFALDEADLRKRYLAAQRESHPDRLVGKSERERAQAVQRSMDINEAYEKLKSPLLRAEHLLALQSIFVNTDGNDTVKPSSELLVEIMELRERLADVTSEAEAAQAVRDMKTAMEQVITRLGDAFLEKNYDAAAQMTMRLRYFGKTLEEAYARQYGMKHKL